MPRSIISPALLALLLTGVARAAPVEAPGPEPVNPARLSETARILGSDAFEGRARGRPARRRPSPG